MRTLLAAVMATIVVFLPAMPADAGPGSGQGRKGGPVRISSSLECLSEDQGRFWVEIRNAGPTVLHIDGDIRAVITVPGGSTTLEFLGLPAPGFDLIEPGSEVTFGISLYRSDFPDAFDAKRIVFKFDLQFNELKRTVLRHTVFPACS